MTSRTNFINKHFYVILIVLFLLSNMFFVSIGLITPRFILNESQVFYICSTSAQVLAAIFALAIPCYFFFYNNLTKKLDNDISLEEAVDEIKKQSYRAMIWICSLTLCAEGLCILTISAERIKTHGIKVLLINLSISLVFFVLILILYCIKSMIDPKLIDKSFLRLDQTKTSFGSRTTSANKPAPTIASNFFDFKKYFCQIEKQLRIFENKYLLTAQRVYHSYKKNRNALSFIARKLEEKMIISPDERGKLIELIYFRNRVFHAENIIVPNEAVEAAKDAAEELENRIKEWETEIQREKI